ncbi:ABC transporter ATP-binding protein [Ureibacillus sp. NPDC094379]
MSLGNSLSIINAVKYYKNFKAVDNVSLTLNQGEFLTILGPSGSGKTSLLKLIAGFESLSSGSIILNNEDISMKKPYERQIGMLFQNYALFPHMTVFDNIAYPLRLRKMPKDEIKEKVEQMLSLVHLEAFGSRYPEQLSGGQQQRVALARAIVFNPPLLLLDEPLGALDKQLRKQMQYEIKRIQETVGITTVSVSHDQEEALTMSDKICVMNKGKIEQIDTPENLYKNPVNRFVAEFVGEINLIKGNVVDVIEENAKVKINDQLLANIKVQNFSNTEVKNKSMFIAVRPENVRIAGEGSQYQNTMRAKIVETIYLGESISLKTEIETGEEVVAKIPSHISDLPLKGSEILLGWNSKDACLIHEETPV